MTNLEQLGVAGLAPLFSGLPPDADEPASADDQIEACREARDWIELAETARQNGDVRTFCHRLGCAMDILKSVRECAE